MIPSKYSIRFLLLFSLGNCHLNPSYGKILSKICMNMHRNRRSLLRRNICRMSIFVHIHWKKLKIKAIVKNCTCSLNLSGIFFAPVSKCAFFVRFISLVVRCWIYCHQIEMAFLYFHEFITKPQADSWLPCSRIRMRFSNP